MEKKYTLDKISDLNLHFALPSIVFLYGDLGAGKTTLSSHIIREIFGVQENITSPTYTYYNLYRGKEGEKIYHFDLYKMKDYDEFFAIGGEEILDNNEGIILIEWPEILENYYKADMKIFLEKLEESNARKITVK